MRRRPLAPQRPDPLSHDQRRARRPSGAGAALRRSGSDRRLAGVAGGVAAFTGAAPGTLRTLFLVSVPLSLGITAGGYLLLWLLLPGPDAAGTDRAGRDGGPPDAA